MPLLIDFQVVHLVNFCRISQSVTTRRIHIKTYENKNRTVNIENIIE